MKTKTQRAIAAFTIPTPDGVFVAQYSKDGLCSLDFPGKTADAEASRRIPTEVRHWHTLTGLALKDALKGKPIGKLPPLDLKTGTAFQQKVWKCLQRIRAGQTRTYGEVAEAIGSKTASRAVGGACGANPIPVLVPCHRVLAANRRLGGFSGGLQWKKLLLQREGISM